MRNASVHQCKVKMSGSEKKGNENTFDISSNSKKHVTKKFLEVSHCNRAKQRQRNVQKSVLHVQSCFFANQTYCCFSPFSGVAFAAQHYTILYLIWTNFKYYRELRFQLWLNLYIILGTESYTRSWLAVLFQLQKIRLLG